MSIYRGRYYSASGCDSSPRPGTRAMMSWFLGAYRDQGAANLGTYVCKRLGSGWSIHAERRAADLGTAPYGGVDSAWGWALANALRLNSAELGVQLIILGRSVWSCTRPDAGWRPYGGAWHGHLHVECIPDAADNLTAEYIEQTLHKEDDVTRDDIEAIAEAVYDRFTGTVSAETWEARRGLMETGQVIHPRTALRKAWSTPKHNGALLAELRGQVAGLAALVRQLAATDPVPLTPEQLATLTAAVETAARGGAADALERVQITVDEDDDT